MSAILEVSGKLNLLMNLNRVPLIVLDFFNFNFPIHFIGGQCFGETPIFHLWRYTNMAAPYSVGSVNLCKIFRQIFEV